MSNLVRKTVTARTKKGKTYRRSVMVRANAKPAQGRLRRAAGKVVSGVNRVMSGKTGSGTAFRMGVASGLGQYAAAVHGLQKTHASGQLWALGSHGATQAALIAKNQASRSFVGRLGQHAAHLGGRVVGITAAQGLYVLGHGVRRGVHNFRNRAK